jgi:hypothetical protein
MSDARRIHIKTLILQVHAWINAMLDHDEVAVTAGGVARVVLDRDRRGE